MLSWIYSIWQLLQSQSDSRLAVTALISFCHTAPVLLGFILYTVSDCIPSIRSSYKIVPNAHTNIISKYIISKIINKNGPLQQKMESPLMEKEEVVVFWQCLVKILVSHIVWVPLIGYYALYPYAAALGPSFVSISELPPWTTFVWQILLYVIVEDFFFFWIHKLLHEPFIYPYVHKVHHKFHSSISIAAEFAHPLENLVGNVFPLVAAGFVVPTHVGVFGLWLFIRMAKTVEAHSGYDFPFHIFSYPSFLMQGSARHHFHHSHNKGCFGSFFTFWDKICGTDAAYNEFVASKKKTN